MGARKIQDEQELIRWFEEGKTYDWMVKTYRDKYHIEIAPSAFGNFRRRRGLDRRITRNDDLIPWFVKPEHRHQYPVMMLRQEARRRTGVFMNEEQLHAIEAWKRGMKELDTVLHYEPDTEQGWFYVPRRHGVDGDLIREPSTKTTMRPAAD